MAIGKKLRFRVFMRDGFTCQYCGVKAPAVQLNVDHVLPVSKGGDDDESNLITACVGCNSGKSNILIPIKLTFENGPLEGTVYETTAHAPLVWVWQDVDGGLVLLDDEIKNASPTFEDGRKVLIGPSWVLRQDRIEELAPRLAFRHSDGARSILIGAYAASDIYPFPHFQQMTWMEPWQLLLDFDFNDPGHG